MTGLSRPDANSIRAEILVEYWDKPGEQLPAVLTAQVSPPNPTGVSFITDGKFTVANDEPRDLDFGHVMLPRIMSVRDREGAAAMTVSFAGGGVWGMTG